jgi:hypothetical protein
MGMAIVQATKGISLAGNEGGDQCNIRHEVDRQFTVQRSEIAALARWHNPQTLPLNQVLRR